MVDTILVGGHNVRTLTGCRVVGLIDGIFAPGTYKGEPEEIPGDDGALPTPLPIDKYIITIPLWIEGSTRGERNDRLRALGPLLMGTRGVVALSRIIDTTSSTATHTAPGQFITGLSPHNLNARTGVVNLQYYQLKGRWSDDGGTTWTLL